MKNKILFEINDTDNIKFGTDLHKKNVDFPDDDDQLIDWSVESMMMAMETAEDMGIKIPNKFSEEEDHKWDREFICKINGITYKVHDRNNRKMKIEKL